MADVSPASSVARGTSLGALQHPVFRAVWIASLASNFGGLIQSVGASWMMTNIAPSPTIVALVQASTTLPIMMLSLLTGAIADNWDRRLVMLIAQSFMLIVSAVLSAFTWAGWITPGLLLGFTFLIGVGTAFNGPAWQASVGEMVPREDLAGAVALNSVGFNIARSVGPAVGGLIVAAAGAAAAFAVNAASYVGLVVVLARWRPERPENPLPRERLATAMGAGLRYVAMSPGIRVVLLRGMAFGLGASSISALMPLVAKHLLGGGPLTYGLLLGAFGVGAVSGAFLTTRLRNSLSTEAVTRWSSGLFGIATACVGLSPVLPLTLVAVAVAGAGWVIALSTFNVSVQMSAPRWVVARALSLYQMTTFGGMAVGSWLSGIAAAYWGVSGGLLAAGLFVVAGIGLGFFFPLPDDEGLDLNPLRAFDEPLTAVDIEPRSGPIVITIEYRIAPEDVREFLTAMAERRRIRLRDGARHWTLLRDLHDPELWTERYHTPTWLDYIRHNQRITKADATIAGRVRALHRGEEPPRVHRLIERQTGSLPGGRWLGARELAGPLTDPTRAS